MADPRRYARRVLALAEEAEPNLVGVNQATWLERLEGAQEELRAALAWAVKARKTEIGLRLAGALWRFWYIRSYFAEGRRWLAEVLALPGAAEPTVLRAKALNAAGNLAYSQGDYPAARVLHQEALELRRQLGDQQGVAASLNNLALVERALGGHEAAHALYEEALALNRGSGNRAWEAINLDNLGNLACDRGDFEAARRLLEASEQLFEQLGDRWGMGMARGDLGAVALAEGDAAGARAAYEASVALRREVGDRRGLHLALVGLAQALAAADNGAEAQRTAHEGFEICAALGNPQDLADCLEVQAAMAGRCGDYSRCARLAGAAAARRGRVGAVGPTARRAALEMALRAAREALGDESYRALWLEGYGMAEAEAVAYALTAAAD